MADPKKRTALDVLADLNTIRKGSMPDGKPHGERQEAKSAEPDSDADDAGAPFAQGRAEMRQRRQNQRESGYSGDINLPAKKSPVDYLRK
jgi:hypothetical protein